MVHVQKKYFFYNGLKGKPMYGLFIGPLRETQKPSIGFQGLGLAGPLFLALWLPIIIGYGLR